MIDILKIQRFPKDSGSATVLLNEAGEILIVKSPYKDYWTLPGGGIDEHETPRNAAIRETKEEIGIDIVDPIFLCIDHQYAPDKGDNYQFLFHGGMLTKAQISAIKLQPEEITEYKFIPVTEIGNYTGKLLAKRVPKSLEAFKEGKSLYLENAE